MRMLAVTTMIALGLIAGPAAAQTAAKQPLSKDAAAAMAEIKDNTGAYPSVVYHPTALPPPSANAPSNINCVPSLAPSTGSLSQQAAPGQPCR
ncbi:MAG TPA: hypothetical protein VG651_21990 [Stellaceae bacterium]|nr:hypothetical protein [Stellaceae bacterium]